MKKLHKAIKELKYFKSKMPNTNITLIYDQHINNYIVFIGWSNVYLQFRNYQIIYN